MSGAPDRMLIKNGVIIFIEFKAPNKKPRPLQKEVIEGLRRAGMIVGVVDDVEQGKRFIDENS